MQRRTRIIVSAILILVFFLFLWRSNQSPNTLLDRIFPPIFFQDGGAIYYTGLFVLVGGYFLIKKICEWIPIPNIHTVWRRILVLVLLLTLFSPLQQGILKGYCALQSGVDALYLHRDFMQLDSEITRENQIFTIRVTGQVDMENCSNTPRSFNMKIRLPRIHNEIFAGNWVEVRPTGNQNEEFIVGGKSRTTLTFESLIKIEVEEGYSSLKDYYGGRGGSSIFEMVLYDETTEAYFEMDIYDKRYYLEE